MRRREKQLGAPARKEKKATPFLLLELGLSSSEVEKGCLSSSPLMLTGVSSDGDGKEEGGRGRRVGEER